MMSNHRRPVWPYLLLLCALFALSVTAPRRWQARPTVHKVVNPSKPRAAQLQRTTAQAIVLHSQVDPPAPAVQRRTAPNVLQSGVGQLSAFEIDPNQSPNPSTATAVSDDAGDDGDAPLSRPIASDTVAGPTFVSIEDDASAEQDLPVNVEPLSHVPPDESTALAENRKPLEIKQTDDDAKGAQQTPDYDLWPIPYAVIERLEGLQEQSMFAQWARQVRESIDQLAVLRLDDTESNELLRKLRSLISEPAAAGAQISEEASRDRQQVQLDLLRRVDLWDRVAAAASQYPVSLDQESLDPPTQQALASVARLCATSPLGAAWRKFLMLDRLEQLAGAAVGANPAERGRVAGIVLTRMAGPRLSLEQRRFLARPEIELLRRRLQVWTIERMELGPLVHTVEEYELAPTSSLASVMAGQTELLVNSSKPVEQRLGRELSRQYCNANLRIVVTQNLLNRLLPQPQLTSDWVNETIVGVPSRGYSTTSTRLGVRLFPARDQLRLGIEAAGVVDSQTSSTAGPVTFLSQGESTYRVGKLVVVDRQGIRVGRAMAEADNLTRLAGMETDYDSFPLVRNIVRGYALNQHEEKQAQARLEVEAKVAARAEQRFDAEINNRLLKAENDFRARVLAPFEKLGLETTVIQLQTTENRLTARMRLANRDQLGAHTQRPIALSNSLASLQFHESVLNNALERFELAGQTFSVPELYQWITKRCGRAPANPPEDLPDNVVVTFADEDPVRVRCHEGRVELKLRFAELDQGQRVWHDFEITVYFRPRYAGLRLELVRDGSIELGGEGHQGRVEAVLRGIFAKVFSQRRKLQVAPQIPPGRPELATLEFSSAVVDNGWISVTVADRPHGRPEPSAPADDATAAH